MPRIPFWYKLLLIRIGKYKYTHRTWKQLIKLYPQISSFSTVLNDTILLLDGMIDASTICKLYVNLQIRHPPHKISRPNIEAYISRFRPLYAELYRHTPALIQPHVLLNTYLIIRQLLDDYKDIETDKQLHIQTLPNTRPSLISPFINKINHLLKSNTIIREYPRFKITLVSFYLGVLKFVHSFHTRYVSSS